MDQSPASLCVCEMTKEEAGRERRPLACRRSVSWYCLRLNIIRETSETAELGQVTLFIAPLPCCPNSDLFFNIL